LHLILDLDIPTCLSGMFSNIQRVKPI